MKMQRCQVCGAFYEGQECADHPNPKPPPAPGSLVRFPWPSNGAPTLGMVTSGRDKDGSIGIALINENVRVNQDDVEEI